MSVKDTIIFPVPFSSSSWPCFLLGFAEALLSGAVESPSENQLSGRALFWLSEFADYNFIWLYLAI